MSNVYQHYLNNKRFGELTGDGRQGFGCYLEITFKTEHLVFNLSSSSLQTSKSLICLI